MATTPTPVHEPVPPSQELLKSWLQKHLDLLEAERQEDAAQSRLLLSKTPAKVLEANGLALLGLSVASVRIGLGAKLLVELERPSAYHSSPVFPSHTFRPGDLTQIEEHDSTKKAATKPVQGVVFRVSDTRIVIAVGDRKKRPSKTAGDDKSDKRDARTGDSNKVSTDQLELPERIRVVKVANEATYNRMERTLDKLAEQLGVQLKGSDSRSGDESDSDDDADTVSTSVGNASGLLRTLVALESPSWSAPIPELPLPVFNTGLNDSQLSAIRFALSSKHFALIHGPPGTGKTTAIVEMIMQLAVGQGQRVLVCGASNLAVDNILERLVGRAEHREALKKKGAGVTRLGHPARVLAGLHNSTLDAQATLSSEGQLVKDVAGELESAMASLRPPSSTAGNKSTRSAPRLKGSERRKMWEEVRELRKEYRRRERGVTTAVLDRAQIVLATCHGAGGRQLHAREFDVVVIDEACQAVEAACWIPILKAKRDGGKVILAGDHLQLPPTVKSIKTHRQPVKRGAGKKNSGAPKPEEPPATTDEEEAITTFVNPSAPKTTPHPVLRPPRSLETTLFSRLLGLYGAGCKALLSVQYRMNTPIMSFPNAELYEGKLEAADSCASIRIHDLSSVEGDQDELWDAPLVFYDTAGTEMYETEEEESLSNANEVELVLTHVRLLLDNGVTQDQIAILAPYSAQVSLLNTRLRDAGFDGLEVGTVDGMQGREKEAVIFSLTRSNSHKNVGFLAEKRRLNVAMTRAKRQLVVIGDSETVSESGEEYLRNWMAFLEDTARVEMVVAMG